MQRALIECQCWDAAGTQRISQIKHDQNFQVRVMVQDLRGGGDGIYVPRYFDSSGNEFVGPPRKLARGVMAAAIRIVYAAERSVFQYAKFAPKFDVDNFVNTELRNRIELRACQGLGEAAGAEPTLFATVGLRASLPPTWTGARQQFSPSFLQLEPNPLNNTFVAVNYIMDNLNELDGLVRFGDVQFKPADLLITR